MHKASKSLPSQHPNLEAGVTRDLFEMFPREYIHQNWPTPSVKKYSVVTTLIK